MAGLYVTAREAAQELDIGVATLYTYVSRGLIRSQPAGPGNKSRRYYLDDIRELKARQAARRNPTEVARRALTRGLSVLDSAISLAASGRVFYRGIDAVELATTRTVEEVAGLIWLNDLAQDGGAIFDQSLTREQVRLVAAISRRLARLGIIERFQVLLPLAGSGDPAASDLDSRAVARTGARILKLFAAIAAGTPGLQAPIAQVLQRAWAPDNPAALRLLEVTLILCVDTDLSPSSFTARCVASVKSSPYDAVLAGLAALKGHGSITREVEAFCEHLRREGDVSRGLEIWVRAGRALPAFGHPSYLLGELYPGGDPRVDALLTFARQANPQSSALQFLLETVSEVERRFARRPGLDIGLAAAAIALDLPAGGALVLCAMGRAIGWIGHAIEQYESDYLIRPRARYTGKPPV